MQIETEQLLHRLGPYLPTDRFRALLADAPLDELASGAAMIVDISGFTPLTIRLVEDYGPKRASEELKRRLNPMFEAIAGQVFTHGGSVIRFAGDGFTAWFPDELPHSSFVERSLPGIVRAAIAGVEMMEMMAFFSGLDLKVALSSGTTRRWVVGDDDLGLVDILVGPAIEYVADLSSRYQRHEVRAHQRDRALLKQFDYITFEDAELGDLLIKRVSSVAVEQSRAHRWPAWEASGDVEEVLGQTRLFIDPLILEQETSDVGSFSGELRYATPVFLRFTGLDYNNDPDAQRKLDAYLRDVQRILRDTRGRLVSLEVGDKGSIIFAVFGAPIAYGDDSQRAVHAAIAFRDLPLRHHAIKSQNIGISRGLLYSGTVGGEMRREYTSLGDETNLASRLMSSDSKGQVLLSKAVYEDCSDWFEFEEAQSILPKGRTESIATFVPVRSKNTVKRNLRKLPVFGRDAELTRFSKSIAAVKNGNPRILRIEGEAGIGKSRMAAELVYLSGGEAFKVATGHCLSTGRNSAFLPWRAILSQVVGIQDEFDAQAIIAVSQWIANENPDWAIRLPLLGELMGLAIPDNATTRNLSGSARQQALFALITDMLYHVSQKTPLTIILEDVHWIDEVSEALAIELVKRLHIDPAPILVGMFHRPIEADEHPQMLFDALEEMYIHFHVGLNEISETAVGEILTTRLGGQVPPDLVAFVFEKSHGNPFFVQEVMDTLVESEAIRVIGKQVYIESDLESTSIPTTVQGLILARIDSLNETEKIVLKMAAVIGRQFEMRLLFRSLPIDLEDQAVMRHMQTLEQRKFSQLENLYPEPTYAFRHAITQEVTYQTLLYDQRRRWHRNVGNVLEQFDASNLERLAYHFGRSDDEERAFAYLVRAGDKTAHEYANQAALDYWSQALALARTDKETFDLLGKRLELLMRTSDQEGVQTDLDTMIILAESHPDNINWQLRRLRYQAEYSLDRGEWEQARTYAEDAATIVVEYGELNLAWDVYSILTRIYTMLGEAEAVTEMTERLRQIAQELKDPSKIIRLTLNDLLELAYEAPDDLEERLNIEYQRIRELGDPSLEANYWNIMSRIALQRVELNQADEYLQYQLGLWRQIGNRRMEGHTLNNLGSVAYMLGQLTDAGNFYRPAFKILNQVGDRWGAANSLVGLGQIAYRREAFGEALAYIQRGLFDERSLGASIYVAKSLYAVSLVHIAQGHYEEARQCLYESFDLYKQTNFIYFLPQIRLAICYVQVQNKSATLPSLDDFMEAIDQLIAGEFQFFHEVDTAFWQARALLQIFDEDLAPLDATFKRYIDHQLDSLHGDEGKTNFQSYGYIPQLLEAIG